MSFRLKISEAEKSQIVKQKKTTPVYPEMSIQK